MLQREKEREEEEDSKVMSQKLMFNSLACCLVLIIWFVVNPF